MKLSNKVYDVLKVLCLILLPIATLIAEIGDILNVPYLRTVSLILIATNTCIGSIVHNSSKNYWKEKDGDDDVLG